MDTNLDILFGFADVSADLTILVQSELLFGPTGSEEQATVRRLGPTVVPPASVRRLRHPQARARSSERDEPSHYLVVGLVLFAFPSPKSPSDDGRRRQKLKTVFYFLA